MEDCINTYRSKVCFANKCFGDTCQVGHKITRCGDYTEIVGTSGNIRGNGWLFYKNKKYCPSCTEKVFPKRKLPYDPLIRETKSIKTEK